MRLSRLPLALCVTVALLAPVGGAFAAVPAVPRGFLLAASAPGVRMYHRRTEYVQVLDPSAGARLRILRGDVLPQGDYPTFPRQDIQDWWRTWSADTPPAFSVVNGQFFDPSDADAAALAFSIKTEGTVYEGYADRSEYPFQKRLLVLYDDRYAIMDYDDDPSTLRRLPAKDILVGLSPKASKSRTKPMPRTFIGLTPTGQVVVLSSSMATQGSADRVLRMFGADPDQTMMLDGGSSAHLVHVGKVVVPVDGKGDRRFARERLPQVVGIEAGR